MNKKLKTALDYVEWEIKSYERAPRLNGCEMTAEWAKSLEIFKTIKTCIEAVSACLEKMEGEKE